MTKPIIVIVICAVVLVVLGIAALTHWAYNRSAQQRILQKENDLAAPKPMKGKRDIQARIRDAKGEDRFVFGNLVDPDSGVIDTEFVIDDSDSSVDVYGGPGSGKSVGVVVPTVLRHRHSALVSTTKTDLAINTIAARSYDGPVVIFDPAGKAGKIPKLKEHVRVWTPITEGVSWPRARETARALLKGVDGAETGGKNEFFQLHAKTAIAALIVYLRTQPGTSLKSLMQKLKELGETDGEGDGKSTNSWQTFSDDLQRAADDLKKYAENRNPQLLKEPKLPRKLKDLHERAAKLSSDVDARQLPLPADAEEAKELKEYTTYLQSVADYERKLQQYPDEYRRRSEEIRPQLEALELAQAALISTIQAAAAPDTRAGILGSIGQVTESFQASYAIYVQPWDADNTLTLDDFMHETHTLYMVCPEVLQRPLTNALLGCYVRALETMAEDNGGKLADQHLVVLDELVHCTPHPELQNWTGNLARSARIKFVLCTQSFSDLVETFGENIANSLHNNCSGGHIALAKGSDPKLAELFTGQAGKRELIQTQSYAHTTSDSKNYGGTVNSTVKGVRDSGSRSKSVTTTETLVEKDVATYANISAMKEFHAVVILKGTRSHNGGAVQVRTTPFFEDGSMRAAIQGDRKALAEVRAAVAENARR
ncbi:type IV secretory system conjugative DNA transfer family protein [Corynebacterium sp. AOP34-AQ2-28]|uniref:type IV secretory system conjugative DNA transfer family protein n=1 Tax=Corynebacterium sp. AOP34-AQ2-28 TaxID=3457689 RepID=UPI003FDAD4FE